MSSTIKHPSSYRDPSGFIFYHNGGLYRQVNQVFKKDFELLTSSGLYQHLVDKRLLIAHKTIPQNLTNAGNWYQTLEPEKIDFISYPYEWCFDMLKDAALLTLQLAQQAMHYGMMLKDASAYNVQWHKGKAIFIDTLSFEEYNEAEPWIAYRQFCEQFLAPLALMHYLKLPLQNLLLAYPDGIPLAVTKKMLPAKSKFHLNSFLHLHLHANLAIKRGQKTKAAKPFSATRLKNLLRSLEEMVQSFSLNTASGIWSGYYDEAFQRDDYVEQKKQIIDQWLSRLPAKTAIDMGANEGEFSELLVQKNIDTISTDFDHYSINKLYNKVKQKNISNILPLIVDLANPSPAMGVNNQERASFLNRAKTDLILALALIHHLAIGKNIPFENIAELFSQTKNYLIVEYVPKSDEKVQLMLEQKRDVYDWYNADNFKAAFSQFFQILESKEIGSSKRVLFLMQSLN